MRILIVCSGNRPNFEFQKHQAFIYDQVEALKQVDDSLQFDYFFIKGQGLSGYLSCLKTLKQQLQDRAYQAVHAHVAMSGMLANLQRRVPVITTFHGSDINEPKLRAISALVERLSRRTIYVSPVLAEKAPFGQPMKRVVIPCGVDFSLFKARPKPECRAQLGLSSDKCYVLFSSNFDNPVKNYALAKAAVERLQNDSVELLELKNYTRQEVAMLFSAVDVALMTSFSEGSPQFVKEALACNCPVVSTDVGDVRLLLCNIPGCYITSFKPANVADNLRRALTPTGLITPRGYIQHLDNLVIARQIRNVYRQLQ